MKTRNFKRVIDNWLLTGLAIGMILLFGTLLTETLGLGPPQCPSCTRWNGTFCQPYCDEIECQICGPLGFCCPNGRCAPLGQICCGTTFCPPDDGCCENIKCRIPGDICCNNGTGHSCPPGKTCHGTSTCCPSDGDYCPGAPAPLSDCCGSGFHCVGNGRCCPKEPTPWTLCPGPDGTWTCCDPSYCNQTCDNGICRDCGGELFKSCCDGECYDTRTQKSCWNTNPWFCWICDINEECCNGFCCDPEKCESCIDGECKVCDGDPTLTCRNGHCCCAANGCGPCGGPAVPNNPAGCDDTSFLEPCNAHDECYGTCGSNKGTCDTNFLGSAELDTGMLGICAGSSCAYACSQAAYAYYGAVDTGGQDAFDASQACSCG